jgi:hypothetical protein
MDLDSEPYFDWVESSVSADVDANFGNTFCQNPDDSRLQVIRFPKSTDNKGEDGVDPYVVEETIIFPDEIDELVVCL